MDQETLFTLATAAKHASDHASTVRKNRDQLAALLNDAESALGRADKAHRDAQTTLSMYVSTGKLREIADTCAPAMPAPAMPAPAMPAPAWGSR